MVGKIKVGYLIPTSAQAQLRALAERDQRSLSGEVAWLIGQEWRRHMLALGLRRVQRARRTRRLQPAVHPGRGENGGPDGNL